MPAPSIKALAKKAGKSEAEAEKLWGDAKKAAKGKKLRDGTTVGSSESAWGDKEWAYVTGIFKKMLGIKESVENYRVYVDGDKVRMVHNGSMVDEGVDPAVDHVRTQIQELLDKDVDTAFDVSGFVGSLEEIEQRVFRDWLIFCDQSPSLPLQAVFADALNGNER
jgi:hypothetical protein